MIKRLVLAFCDLRAQVRLAFAEIRADDAIRIRAEAVVELQRASDMVAYTDAGLRLARADADAAIRDVRRHYQRAAVGLR
jgi:hypothetical protein